MTETISTPVTDARSIDTALTLLSSDCRRDAVDAIAERDPPIEVRELAQAIADRETNDASPTSDDIAAVLHHVHLPALDDAAVIDYDVETNTVKAAQAGVLQGLVDGSDGSR